MPFSLTQYALVSLILFASSVIQGSVGFAAGIFGIPLLTLTGLRLQEAVGISFVASAVQACIPCWQLRRDIDVRLALRPLLIRLATLPLGVLALRIVGQSNNDFASQLVGVIVLGILGLQQLWGVRPEGSLHPAWEWIAFSLGGFLAGLCLMGGPPMVLWVLAHNWSMARSRAFIYFIFTASLPVQALLLWLAFGSEILRTMLLGLAVLPAVFVGLYAGLYLGRLLPDRVLRRLCEIVLVVIAISAILQPLLR